MRSGLPADFPPRSASKRFFVFFSKKNCFLIYR